jgi:O-antigen/teichoic acid export membrane protein
LFQAISNVSVPAFSRLQHDPARLRETMYQGMRLSTVVMFAIFPGAAMIAPDLVVGLFGPNWESAGTLCSLLCFLALVQSLFVFTYAAMLATKLQRSHLGLSIVSAAGTWLACVIGIQYGLPYVVLGLIIKSVIVSPISLLLLKRRIGLSLASYFRPCLVPAGAALCMIATLQLVNFLLPSDLPRWLRLASCVAAGAIGYLGFLRLVSRERMEHFRLFVTQAIRGPKGAG